MKTLGTWTITSFVVAVLLFAFAPLAHGATRYVKDNGTDGSNCGIDLASACRSITQAIALAANGDTILVGPGRYGDLNRNGVLGDVPGEETGSPGCGCVLSINKPVIILSSAGAAATVIDGRSVDTLQTVLLITNGGEFGRPGKGFTVTETARQSIDGKFFGDGIVLDSANVKVRGNQVIFTRWRVSPVALSGFGIRTVNEAPILIEGNLVMNWRVGIFAGRGAFIVRKNQVMSNEIGIGVFGGTVTGNVATANTRGIFVANSTTVTSNALNMNSNDGLLVDRTFDRVVSKSNFLANGRAGASCGLFNDSVPDLTATNNYWGTATGPGAPPADGVCGSGTTTTSPFATEPFTVKPLKP